MESATLANLLSFQNVTDLLAAVVNVVIVVSVPIIVFFLIYAGFKYVTAQGNPQQIEVAQKSLLYGVIGGVIILGSVALLTIFKDLAESF